MRAPLGAWVLCCALAACKPGNRLVYTTRAEATTAVARTVEARLRALGSGARVTTEPGRLVIEVPRLASADDLAALLDPRGVLCFARVDDDLERGKHLAAYVEADSTARRLGVSWVAGFTTGPGERGTPDLFLSGDPRSLRRYLDGLPPEQTAPYLHRYVIESPEGKPARTYYLDLAGAVTITNVAEAQVVARPAGLSGYAVNVKLGKEDGERLGRLTTAMVGQRLAILLDDRALSVAHLQTPLHDEAQLQTDGRKESSERLAAILTAGALPASMRQASR